MRIRATVEVRVKGSIGAFHKTAIATRCAPGTDVTDCVLMEARRRGYEPRHVLALVVILDNKEVDESPPDDPGNTPMDDTGFSDLK